MKTLFSFLLLCVITVSAFSQTQAGAVTVNVTGNRTKQIAVDSRYYTISNTSISSEQAVVINDLENGPHTLEIIRHNQYNKSVSTKSTFTLREGFSLVIDISPNGSITSSETRIDNRNTNSNAVLSVAAFNKIFAAAKKKTNSAARATYLETQLATINRRLTSKQASQLIQLVNSESLRLKLSKQSYSKISDTQNFSLVSNLLRSSANRTELSNYIALLSDEDEDNDTDVIAGSPMTDEQFRTIYAEVNVEYGSSNKNYYLNNFFNKEYNFYTTSQAKQFIEMVTPELDRFELTKNAYRGITDKENYSDVYSLLNNTSNRTALIAYINAYDNTNVRPAMTDVQFNKLYQSVYYQNSTTARYTTINNAFTTSGNYFTAVQAKQIIPLVNIESSRLLLSKAVYKRLVDRANYTEFNSFLSVASRTDLYNYVRNYDNSNSNSGVVAMNETDYNQLYNSINSVWSTASRVNLTTEAFNNYSNYFTTFQVRRLVLLINSENDRLTLSKLAYDNVTDQANYSQLYDVFSNTNNRNDLANFVAGVQNGSGTVVKIPMTETEFNSMYRNVQFSFGFGVKMSALTEIFNKETNYFTVQQVKKLIPLVSDEDNRLQLAKASYNNITDQASFTELYDLFSLQASKDELASYVSNAYNNK